MRSVIKATLLLIAPITILYSCNSEKINPKTDLPTLSVGIQVSPAMALVMVAEEQGFFDKEGVDVVIEKFTAGKFALQAFLGNSIDIAVSGEVPVTLSTLQGNEFRVIGQVVDRTINEVRVVAQKENEIDTPQSYFSRERRRIATSFGGGPEFFTHEFLVKHGISPHDVELISQRPEDMPSSLANGAVDAIAIFDPFAAIAELRLGDKAISFTDNSIYSELYVIDVHQKLIDERREELLAFLRGLRAAQTFIKNNPDTAKEIVESYTKLDREIIDLIWGNFVFEISINDLFIEYTTAQAEWYIEKGTVPTGTPIPNFLSILDASLLQEVDPKQIKLTQIKRESK